MAKGSDSSAQTSGIVTPAPAAAPPARVWTTIYDTPTVAITVGKGDDVETFRVPRTLLVKNSDVMATMLTGMIIRLLRIYAISFRTRYVF